VGRPVFAFDNNAIANGYEKAVYYDANGRVSGFVNGVGTDGFTIARAASGRPRHGEQRAHGR
jgi:hypothetical protein